MVVRENVGMSVDDFVRRYAQHPFEFMDDEWREILPNLPEHGELMRLLVMALFAYDPKSERAVIYFEMPYVLRVTTNWLKGALVPDILIYQAERLARYKAENPEWGSQPLPLIPDLCVEIISPSDVYIAVDAKVRHYLSHGVRIVWLVNPRTQTLTIHTAGSNQITSLTREDTLTGGDLLPEFSLKLSDLFVER
jgi:Uma2 family endonuclease